MKLATEQTSPVADVVQLIEAREAASSGRGARLRRAAGLSQSELAAAIGVTPSCLCRWEAGERRPSGSGAAAYAHVLRQIAAEITRPTNREGRAGNAVPETAATGAGGSA